MRGACFSGAQLRRYTNCRFCWFRLEDYLVVWWWNYCQYNDRAEHGDWAWNNAFGGRIHRQYRPSRDGGSLLVRSHTGEQRVMPSILLPRRFYNLPQGAVQIDWSNPITRDLAFCHLTVHKGFDLVGKKLCAIGGSPTFDYEGFTSTGLTAGTYIQVSDTRILGPLSNSTVFALSRTSAATTTSNPGAAGTIGPGGNAIYSERGSSGNDIYKLAWSRQTYDPACEFTYRNDAGNLLQQRINAYGLNDGSLIASALIKNGSSHIAYVNGSYSSGTYGYANNFTGSVESWIGDDKGDTASPWNGKIPLVVGWRRSLSMQEIESLRFNPGQLFRVAE